jgi:hypothetical protein
MTSDKHNITVLLALSWYAACMRTNVHVLYVPGLGDAHVTSQRLVVKTWHLWGVEAEIVQMNWAINELWETKLARLLTRIDELIQDGKLVGLIGASAGASAVINAYAQRKSQVIGCVLIAAKVNYPDTIGANYRRRSPAFLASARDCEKALHTLDDADRRRILSRYAVFDDVVARRDSYVQGARNQVVISFGHAVTIGTQIIFGARSFIGFLEGLTYGDQTR